MNEEGGGDVGGVPQMGAIGVPHVHWKDTIKLYKVTIDGVYRHWFASQHELENGLIPAGMSIDAHGQANVIAVLETNSIVKLGDVKFNKHQDPAKGIDYRAQYFEAYFGNIVQKISYGEPLFHNMTTGTWPETVTLPTFNIRDCPLCFRASVATSDISSEMWQDTGLAAGNKLLRSITLYDMGNNMRKLVRYEPYSTRPGVPYQQQNGWVSEHYGLKKVLVDSDGGDGSDMETDTYGEVGHSSGGDYGTGTNFNVVARGIPAAQVVDVTQRQVPERTYR